jgi:hypothetical protein
MQNPVPQSTAVTVADDLLQWVREQVSQAVLRGVNWKLTININGAGGADITYCIEEKGHLIRRHKGCASR